MWAERRNYILLQSTIYTQQLIVLQMVNHSLKIKVLKYNAGFSLTNSVLPANKCTLIDNIIL